MMRSYRHHFYKPTLLFVVVIALMALLIGVQAQNTDTCEPYAPDGWVAYTVRAGDTLSGLAWWHNVTVEQLQYLNCIRERSQLYVGQTIYVPGTDALNCEAANFALQCYEAGNDEPDCIRMMAMLGEINGNALLTRCRNEGFDENTCQWMMTTYTEEAEDGLYTRCRDAGFDNATCYQMMLALGQEDVGDILDRCFDGETDSTQCQWIMTNLYSPQGDRIRDRDRTRDQDCTEDCEPIQDRDRDRTRDQDCTEDCEPIQDRDHDRTQNQDGDGSGAGERRRQGN